VLYQPPIDAPIVDPFRPPATRYGPGNRGVEYATRPGTPVRAAADGVVTFAGQVGGQLYVTIGHADGVRTSYSYLASVAVRAGAHVQGGSVLGTTGARVHVGARRNNEYFDPTTLWSHRGRAVLVPLGG
jgi:murein DD-endopeptidase MepM/ murein hydrolase activator NlpD